MGSGDTLLESHLCLFAGFLCLQSTEQWAGEADYGAEQSTMGKERFVWFGVIVLQVISGVALHLKLPT